MVTLFERRVPLSTGRYTISKSGKRISDAFIRARAPVIPEPPVFSPSFQKEGLREAPPHASKPILRSAKAREHAPPTTAAAP